MGKEKMISDILDDLYAYYDQYRYYADLLNVVWDMCKYEGKLDKTIAPNFMRIANAALIDAFMLTEARLFDDDENAKTIFSLLNKCKNNTTLFFDEENVKNKISEFEKRIHNDEYLTRAIETIKMRRDKIFAHNDSKFFKDINKDKSHLPLYEHRMLCDFVKEVLDYFIIALNEEIPQGTIYDEDVKNIFELCKK